MTHNISNTDYGHQDVPDHQSHRLYATLSAKQYIEVLEKSLEPMPPMNLAETEMSVSYETMYTV
ncbi:hypothetical protein QIS74_04777 [Colletotrichum tabaci]|uniref:Uncharacterized protein n=1 Tax=Colletotrichum tabaci TaxID=1209068 RepID=A0AAV9THF7_9PEZI